MYRKKVLTYKLHVNQERKLPFGNLLGFKLQLSQQPGHAGRHCY